MFGPIGLDIKFLLPNSVLLAALWMKMHMQLGMTMKKSKSMQKPPST